MEGVSADNILFSFGCPFQVFSLVPGLSPLSSLQASPYILRIHWSFSPAGLFLHIMTSHVYLDITLTKYLICCEHAVVPPTNKSTLAHLYLVITWLNIEYIVHVQWCPYHQISHHPTSHDEKYYKKYIQIAYVRNMRYTHLGYKYTPGISHRVYLYILGNIYLHVLVTLITLKQGIFTWRNDNILVHLYDTLLSCIGISWGNKYHSRSTILY